MNITDQTAISAQALALICGGIAALIGLLVRAGMWVRDRDLAEIRSQIDDIRSDSRSTHESIMSRMDKIEAKLDRIIEAHVGWRPDK